MFRTTAGGARAGAGGPRQRRAPGRQRAATGPPPGCHRPAPRIAQSRDDRKRQDSPERAMGRPILLVPNATGMKHSGADFYQAN